MKEKNRIVKKHFSDKWEDLDISNDFIFTDVMKDKELCLELLRRIFPNLNIAYIKYTQNEKSLKSGIENKGIRLDVYVKDDKDRVYDIEIQTTKKEDIERRTRFYSSIIDFDLLKKGRSYRELKDSYIVFICMFDMFKKGRSKYTFKYICEEDTSIKLDTGQEVIFLNPYGSRKNINHKLGIFLDYLVGKTDIEDAYIDKLKDRVETLKMEVSRRRDKMTLEQMMIEERYDGRMEGIEIGKVKERENLIKNMYYKGFSQKDIVEISGIDEEELGKIISKLNL